jgi:hypothetical protein
LRPARQLSPQSRTPRTRAAEAIWSASRTRACARLQRREQALTREDYERLCLTEPQVAKARCLAGPSGTARILVLRNVDKTTRRLLVSDLVPSVELKNKLGRDLADYQLLGVTLAIEDPKVRRVRVCVAVLVASDVALGDEVRSAIETTLYEQLHPLKRGFGAIIESSRLLAAVAETPGLMLVTGLRLYEISDVVDGDGSPRERQELLPDRVELAADEVVVSDNHLVHIEAQQR